MKMINSIKILLKKKWGTKHLLMVKDAALLEKRSEKNKNENTQFTRYFWSLGFAMNEALSKRLATYFA